MSDLDQYFRLAVDGIRRWEASFGDVAPHPSLSVDSSAFETALGEYVDRLGGNYPFFHPRYAGQMLKPPHPAAAIAYLAAMLINPNNHALDGGPPTSEMEKEVVRDLASLFGLPSTALGHLTSSGTIANLEALFVSRELAPGRKVAFSEDAHYTHARMCGVLGVEGVAVPADTGGRMDMDALEEELRSGGVGTVVLTAGTTGFGSVDDISAALALRERYGVRLHVDAAYGGFFRLLAHDEEELSGEVRRSLLAISECDSVVVDPHKHGLQPYGCGAVLFRDPTVGRFYRHDSPYTYFTSSELHLGEISLECSRAGAAAGALWLTLRVLPLAADQGVGAILRSCVRAARSFAAAIKRTVALRLFQTPSLDIVTYFPAATSMSEIDGLSSDVLSRLMHDKDDPIFLSVLRAPAERFKPLGIEADCPSARILRSVLMKPEHEQATDFLIDRLESSLRTFGEASG